MRVEESFEAFMRRALYDPERGYYARQVRGVGGWRGDFATAATLSDDLGRSVARWVKDGRRRGAIRHVIEVGAGDGRLMEAVRHELGWWVRRGMTFHVVEVSAPLRAVQQERLRGMGVVWHETLEAALAVAGGGAWMYHNELLDAFPCRRLEWRGGRWQEVWVRSEAGRVTEEWLKPLPGAGEEGALVGFSALDHWTGGNPPAEGQRIELHAAVRAWMRAWAPSWTSGEMLTVDYGGAYPGVYERRRGGTLRGYWMQHRVEGGAIYEHVGRQDLTADINFSDYERWGGELGWGVGVSESQAAWLRRWGLGGSAMAEEAGAGGAFRCVVFRKD